MKQQNFKKHEYQDYYLPKESMFERTKCVDADAYLAYLKAYYNDLKLELGQSTKEDIGEMFDNYLQAWIQGVDAAGVNLLHHLFKIKYNLLWETGDKVSFSDRVMDIIDVLTMLQNPAGEYYNAIYLMADLLANGLDEATNFKKGTELLFKLWTEGNEYAKHYVSWIYNSMLR